MSTSLAVAMAACLALSPGLAAQSPASGLSLKSLPAAVQSAIRANLDGGAIKHISKETENGVAQYEVETIVNGASRDFNVDAKGRLLVVEVATTLDAVPAAAKTSILAKVGGGMLVRVETFTKTGQALMYEATFKDKTGKAHEVLVKTDGTLGQE